MINILQTHLAKYPLMQIQDIAKLLFQSEFGGGHMIADKEKSLSRIQDEYTALSFDTKHTTPVLEEIGNGMSRIYLSCMSNHLSANTLNEIFVESANHHVGTIENLELKITQFLDACDSNVFPFSTAECISFFHSWKEKGYPAISHSEIYRKNYHPAYRVIDSSYALLYNIVQAIGDGTKSTIIAIDGMCGSGKTTLGQLLHQNYPNSNLFHMDDFFLQPYQRTMERLSEIGGNIDYERFQEEVLNPIANKQPVLYRKYNCQTQRIEETAHMPWQTLTIIEGAYSQHPYFENCYDIRVFCEISTSEQKERILKRNGQDMWTRFENEWIPMENKYFETYHIKEKSGLQ